MLNYPLLYLEHLSPRDLDLLAETAEGDAAETRAGLARRPEAVDDLLGSPRLYEKLFDAARRVLSHIPDRHLFDLEPGWLTGPAG